MISSRDIFRMSRLLRKLVNFEAAYDDLETLGLFKSLKIRTVDAVEAGLVPADFTTQLRLNVMVVSDKGEKVLKLMEGLKKEVNLDSIKPISRIKAMRKARRILTPLDKKKSNEKGAS